MHQLKRRSFLKNSLAGAAIMAAGSGASRAAQAADDIKDVKFAHDPKQPQPGLESAHTPSISVEKVERSTVAYGKTAPGDFYRVSVQARHEATREHAIFGVALYLNGELVAEHTMNRARPEASLPAVTFVQRLDSGDELLAVSHCNLHGKWGSRATV